MKQSRCDTRENCSGRSLRWWVVAIDSITAPCGTQADCTSKCFSRGQDFFAVDTGNHALKTLKTATMLASWQLNPCSQSALQKSFDTDTNLVLVHFQQLNFGEWLLHILRGASDYGFNNRPAGTSCAGNGVHYCIRFQRMLNHNFSYHALRKSYFDQVCSAGPYLSFEDVSKAYCHS